jgi:hypothetical protein
MIQGFDDFFPANHACCISSYTVHPCRGLFLSTMTQEAPLNDANLMELCCISAGASFDQSLTKQLDSTQ